MKQASSNRLAESRPDGAQAAAPVASGARARPAASTRGVYIISPSSAEQDPQALDRAVQALGERGFPAKLDRTAQAVHQRFAGTDAQRLASFSRAIKQKKSIVMASRGGYGLSRLLPQIDWRAMADSGKRFVGLSDFTAFNLALLAQTGAVSYTGVTAAPDFGGKEIDELTDALFGELMRGELEILSFETADADPVDCRGILWGGNLAVLVSLLGTPYFPKIRGGILFLEDVAEHPYRIERMLCQLWQAGVLERQKAIVLGHFSNYRLGAHDRGYDMPEVLAWLRRTVKVPVITGLPYGHVATRATLPIGKRIGIATEAGMCHLVLDEHDHDHDHDHGNHGHGDHDHADHDHGDHDHGDSHGHDHGTPGDQPH